MFFGSRHIKRIGVENGGNEQRLRRHLASVERVLEFLVEDAFVSRVHVDDDQPLRALGEDVHAVQLGQRITCLLYTSRCV